MKPHPGATGICAFIRRSATTNFMDPIRSSAWRTGGRPSPSSGTGRWYSVALGSRIYGINVDSTISLLSDSDQGKWLAQQLQNLPATVDFLLISLHHPPVADIQKHIEVDHNPRPNEIALRDTLTEAAAHMHARIIVSAGHIHNYERQTLNDVVYLVSGGGRRSSLLRRAHRGRPLSKRRPPELSLHQVHSAQRSVGGSHVSGVRPGSGLVPSHRQGQVRHPG